MSDPNERSHPKFYKGEYWEYSVFDQGGVHINSGVLNYWYVLLCEGGKGNNEINENFEVTAIGFDAAIKIVFRMLTKYLTPTSQYNDAYYSSLNATEDIFGFCSNEYQSVKQAWHAIGFDQGLEDKDLSIQFLDIHSDACEFNAIDVNIQIINNSCNTTFASGTSIQVGFKFNNFIPINDIITLKKPLRPKDTISYTFSNKIKVRKNGSQRIVIWLSQLDDPNQNNDTSRYEFDFLPYQNTDFSIVETLPNSDLICSEYDKVFLNNQIIYWGCDTLPKNTVIPYSIILAGDTTYKDFITNANIAPRNEINFTTKINVTTYGWQYGEIELIYPNDNNKTNNKKKFTLYKIKRAHKGFEERFDNQNMDSTKMLITTNFNNTNQILNNLNGNGSLYITGRNIFNNNGELLIRRQNRADLFFRLNEDFITTISFCVDISQIEEPILEFDLAQTKSTIDYSSINIDTNNSTMVGLKIDSKRLGQYITNPSKAGEYYHYEFDLSPYKKLHSVNIQIQCLSLQSSLDGNTGKILIDGDNNIIDNIKLIDRTSTKSDYYANDYHKNWRAAPNPTFNFWSLLRTPNDKNFNNIEIVLYDITGKKVYHSKYDSVELNIGHDLPRGIYLLMIKKNGLLKWSEKLIKQ